MAMNKPRYIMIGGFLGAGKSTAVGKLTKKLTDAGMSVGLIINDQGSQLVDAVNLRSQGFAVEEITGGCFCCRFNSLMRAAENLTAAARPDVFIAEPVGSCTDLVATVSYPLRRIYGESYAISPLSVLIDPKRAMRILGLESGPAFSAKVVYIYKKQLEEAPLLVINKCDLLDDSQRSALRAALAREYPQAEIFEVSSRRGDGLDRWFGRIMREEIRPGSAMEVDYETYAEGEALLGWLNCSIHISSNESFDGNALLREFARNLQERIVTSGGQIAHLKMTLSSKSDVGSKLGETAVLSLVRNDYVPELSRSLNDPLTEGELIVNLRAEAEPEILKDAITTESNRLQSQRQIWRLEHVECFKPGEPQPTHRLAALT